MHPLTETWWRLLINRADGTIRRGSTGWIYTPRPVTLTEMEAALQWRQSLGVYAVDALGMSRWLCLDADTDAGGQILIDVASGLNPATTLFEVSQRGGHLWWFCPPTPWRQVQEVGRALVKEHPEIEIFPKGAGRNGVRVPLTRHPVTNRVYPVVDPGTGQIREMEDLRRLCREPLPQLAMPLPAPASLARQVGVGAFEELLAEVERLTSVRVYAPERAIGRCPFHDDHRPSLSLLGGFWRCWAGCGEGGVKAFQARAQE